MSDWNPLVGVAIAWGVGLALLVNLQIPLLRNLDGSFSSNFYLALVGLTLLAFLFIYLHFLGQNTLMPWWEWKEKAINLLRANHPSSFRSHMVEGGKILKVEVKFEGHPLDKDGAVLHVFKEALSQTGEKQSWSQVVFGSLERGGPILVSDLDSLAQHELACHADNVLECYRIYRGRVEPKFKQLTLGERIAGVAQTEKEEVSA